MFLLFIKKRAKGPLSDAFALAVSFARYPAIYYINEKAPLRTLKDAFAFSLRFHLTPFKTRMSTNFRKNIRIFFTTFRR